jgi:hypothetical protein
MLLLCSRTCNRCWTPPDALRMGAQGNRVVGPAGRLPRSMRLAPQQCCPCGPCARQPARVGDCKPIRGSSFMAARASATTVRRRLPARLPPLGGAARAWAAPGAGQLPRLRVTSASWVGMPTNDACVVSWHPTLPSVLGHSRGPPGMTTHGAAGVLDVERKQPAHCLQSERTMGQRSAHSQPSVAPALLAPQSCALTAY